MVAADVEATLAVIVAAVLGRVASYADTKIHAPDPPTLETRLKGTSASSVA